MELMEEKRDIYEETFRKAVIAVGKHYVRGALYYGEKTFPSLMKEIFSIEDKLNEIWKKNHTDENGVKEFRELLKRWYFLHLNIIEKYKKHIKAKNKNHRINVTV